ncbi:uncharacterized protein [Argopecten irradians]|uniref:uncharacterized protein isoform X2 n=1 Tax=Argopecten irradians TaxID=31199 RepID=UPI0037140FA4
MASNFPTMKMNSRYRGEKDDMYNAHGHAGNMCREVILDNLGRILLSRPRQSPVQPVNIADFGTADGNASLSLIKEMIDVVHTHLGDQHPIVVYYNDHSKNDFNLLSKVIQGTGQEPGLVTGNVYPMMIPRTMYEQCLPDNSVDVAISTVATHYLSKRVCQIKNGIMFEEADEEERKMIREQGKTDWRAFVLSRGRELKPGGALVVLTVSSNGHGEMSSVFYHGQSVFGRIVSDMTTEGILTQKEYLATNFHVFYGRNEDDFREPFTSGLPDIKKLGLELVSIKLTTRHYNTHTTDKLKYSQMIVAMVIPWMHHVVYGGLSNSRSEKEKEEIISQYFDRLQTYAYNHSDFIPYMFFTEVVIKRNKK